MLIRKITYKNGRTIYRKTDLLEKINYYDNYFYSIVFSVTLILALILRGWKMEYYNIYTKNGLCINCLLSVETVKELKNQYDVKIKKSKNKRW